MKYVCTVCGWEYDESAGVSRGRYHAGNAMERGTGGF